MIVRAVVKQGVYYDSVTLMRVQEEVRGHPGVIEAGLVLGTDANKALLQDAGLLTPETSTAGPDDLLISVAGQTAEAAQDGLLLADRLLSERRRGPAQGVAYRPRTIAAARRMVPDATVAAISVPGRFAGGVAREALAEGLHVFMFSDNVPLETELALKRQAAQRGLLCMGPDCGTALIGGVGLGFANRVRRGSIGIVAAAGTGLQEVSSLIHRLGGGVSHAIGTGGRDVSEAVGGMTMLQGMAALAADPETLVLVLVSKPPHAAVASRLLGAAGGIGKPVVVALVGAGIQPVAGRAHGRVHMVETLEQAARKAVRLADGQVEASENARVLPAQEAGRLMPGQRYLRGLFSGGTLCAEAQAILRGRLAPIRSNAPIAGSSAVDGLEAASGHAAGHLVLDMGGDEFTQGRLHPMIDPSLRLQRLAREAADPEVGVVLLDVVLGYGADRDPSRTLAPAIADAKARAVEAGRYLCVVGSICGTDQDPQDYDAQRAALLEAGMVVESSNARAAMTAGLILEARAGRNVEGAAPSPPWDVQPEAVQLPGSEEVLRLLQRPVSVLNVGLELFAESLREQGVPVLDLDWQPPAGGKTHLLDLLDRLEA